MERCLWWECFLEQRADVSPAQRKYLTWYSDPQAERLTVSEKDPGQREPGACNKKPSVRTGTVGTQECGGRDGGVASATEDLSEEVTFELTSK